MVELETTPGRTCIITGEEFLFFSGYSYLGMNHVKEFTGLVKEGIDKYGLLFPSSRISNSRLNLYEQFENNLSLLTGMEDTVSFSSGFLAGRAIASVLSSYKNILAAPGTHPAIVPGNDPQQNYDTFDNWVITVVDAVNASPDNQFLLICDSINILTGEIHDLSFLNEINPKKELLVLIDHSHGIGLTKTGGEDSILNLPENGNIEYVVCYSLSKALNIPGGAISCSKKMAGKLRQHPYYTASTATSPSMMYAYLKGSTLYDLQRKKLWENVRYLKSKTASSPVLRNNFPLPVFICALENAEEYFYTNKAIISSFRYPFPYSDKIDRIIINALHTKDDIDQLCYLL